MITDNKLIFKNIRKHIALSDEEVEFVSSLLKEIRLKRKDKTLTQGQIAKNIYFVEDGSVRAFNINDDGKESTIMFAVSDWWITDMDSFMNQSPSNLTIVAMEDSQLLELPYRSLQTLLVQFPKFERFFRILFQNAYIREQRRALHTISMSTEERYQTFIKKYPAIVEKYHKSRSPPT